MFSLILPVELYTGARLLFSLKCFGDKYENAPRYLYDIGEHIIDHACDAASTNTLICSASPALFISAENTYLCTMPKE